MGCAKPYRDITTRELSGVLRERRVIDVREADEFRGELGHLPGAELVPLATLTATAASWPKGAPLLMVCRSGKRSARAAELLVQLGFEDVSNLSGGMLAVNHAKLAVERP